MKTYGAPWKEALQSHPMLKFLDKVGGTRGVSALNVFILQKLHLPPSLEVVWRVNVNFQQKNRPTQGWYWLVLACLVSAWLNWWAIRPCPPASASTALCQLNRLQYIGSCLSLSLSLSTAVTMALAVSLKFEVLFRSPLATAMLQLFFLGSTKQTIQYWQMQCTTYIIRHNIYINTCNFTKNDKTKNTRQAPNKSTILISLFTTCSFSNQSHNLSKLYT